MDGAFVIPGTGIRMGLDHLIGLVPMGGDLRLLGGIASYLIWEARRLGAPRWLIARMVANTAIEAIFGAVPVLGDAFDVLFRAKLRTWRCSGGTWRKGMTTGDGPDHRGRGCAR